jgi:hypothetical protein
MRAVVRETGVTARVEDARPSARQTRVVIRRVQPWSVFKFSLLFYFCLMLVFLFALLILYWVLSVLGVLDSLANVLHEVGFGPKQGTFQFHSFWIFSRLFLIGVVGVLVWSFVNLFVTLLYNLVSDVVGGIQVTLSDRR